MQDEALWRDLYRRAVDEVVPVSGFYHDNYLVQRDGVIYVVRVNRKLDEPDVEPRMYAEAAILAALRNADIEGYSRARIIVGKTLRTIGVPT